MRTEAYSSIFLINSLQVSEKLILTIFLFVKITLYKLEWLKLFQKLLEKMKSHFFNKISYLKIKKLKINSQIKCEDWICNEQ